jgi:hypothetical protein
LEENVPNGNQRISLVEMDEISLYESINENQVLANLSLNICNGLVGLSFRIGPLSFLH